MNKKETVPDNEARNKYQGASNINDDIVLNTIDMLSEAERLTNMGFIVHPLTGPLSGGNSPGKRPIKTGWQKLNTPVPTAVMAGWWGEKAKTNYNIGLVCGRVSGVMVLDVDSDLFIDELFDGVEINTLKSARVKGRGHVYFKYDPGIKSQKHHIIGLEILSDGNNAVLPPSTHVSGDVYHWEDPNAPIQEIPEKLKTRLCELFEEEKRVNGLIRQCRPCFKKVWKDKVDVHGADGRQVMLALCVELMAKGATVRDIHFVAKIMYGADYDQERTSTELGNANGKPWKCDTIKETIGHCAGFEDCATCKVNKGEHKQEMPEAPVMPAFTPAEPIPETIDLTELKAQNDTEKRRLNIDFGEGHFITKYTEYMASVTDAYSEFGVAGGLILLSTIVRGKMVLPLKQDPIYPNLWGMLVANSTTSRKSTAINKCEGFFDSIEIMRKGPSSYSPEGLVEHLSEYPKSAFFRDEVAGLLAEYKKPYMSGIRDFDCMLYDCKTIAPRKLRTKKGVQEEFEIINPYTVKFYATTPDSLSLNTDIVDLTSGYLFRFLFFTPTYDKPFMPLGMEVQENIDLWADILKSGKQLKANIDYLSNTQPNGLIKFDIEPDALKFIQVEQERIETSVTKTDDAIMSSIVGRATPYAFKLAMLIEIGKAETSYCITLDSMQKGLDMAMNYFVPNLKDLVDYVIADERCNQIDKIINFLKRNHGISTHAMALRGTKLKAKEFKECIDTLIESETIRTFRDSKTKGILYKLINEDVSKMDYKTEFGKSSPRSPSSPSSRVPRAPEKSGELVERNKEPLDSVKSQTRELVSIRELGNDGNFANAGNFSQRDKINEVRNIIINIKCGDKPATHTKVKEHAEHNGITDIDTILEKMQSTGTISKLADESYVVN